MTEFRALEPVKNRPRVDFIPENFRKQILAHWLRVTWEKAGRCPCFRALEVVGDRADPAKLLYVLDDDRHVPEGVELGDGGMPLDAPWYPDDNEEGVAKGRRQGVFSRLAKGS